MVLQVSDLKYIKVRPILLRKGDVKVALYGLSNVKDERLHRLFRENKVCCRNYQYFSKVTNTLLG